MKLYFKQVLNENLYSKLRYPFYYRAFWGEEINVLSIVNRKINLFSSTGENSNVSTKFSL